jgi:hypothetical protein
LRFDEGGGTREGSRISGGDCVPESFCVIGHSGFIMPFMAAHQRLSLLSVGSLEGRLGDLLGAKVDLSSADWMDEDVRKQALSEAVIAF